MEASKKMKKNVFGKVFICVFCLVTFGLMLTMADFFSNLITVGGFSFAGDNINQNEYKVYAVCTSSHQEKIIASEGAEYIKQQGGAGYVYMNESSYNIVAGMYETEADAKKVLSNIIEKKPDASIVVITIPQIIISSNLGSQEKSAVSSCIGLFKSVYKRLYDISVSLDTAVINEVKARLEINDICSNAQKILNNFNTIFNGTLTTNLLSIKLSTEDIIGYLNELTNSTSSLPFTSLVKECYCKVIGSYKTMAESI